MSNIPRFTTSGPYRRNAAHDRRMAHGDDFAGDCWEEPGGVRFWVLPGHVPSGPRTFEECPTCWGQKRITRYLGDSPVPNQRCPRCDGVGWVQVASPERADD